MRVIDESGVRAALTWPPLIEALKTMFADGCTMPVRHHHTMTVPDEPDATLLLMPAWTSGGYLGVKLATVFPGNAARGLPAVSAGYLLCSAKTGEILALIDGGELTSRRTAAASALAASYLARPDAANLLIVGTGRLAPNLAAAHAAVRPIRRITVWGRSQPKALALADSLATAGFEAAATEDLAQATAQADIVSCATLSTTPLIRGDWLSPGVHLDLVGGFTPAMREADDTAVTRSTLFADTRDGVLKEAGDIVQPIAAGIVAETDIAADLYDLTRGTHPGRTGRDEITLFKSVGAALEDLAGAVLVYDRTG
ncbi:MAG: ornithine cyclodeaminase family protein [Inquilinaceae bacterium]